MGEGLQQIILAAKYFEEVAEDGELDAEVIIAKFYRNGVSVSQNLENSLKWLHRAAESGNKEAIEILTELK